MIVVTGATGFVGRYLVAELAEKGQPVLACGRNSSYVDFFADLKVPFVTLDVTRPEEFAKLPSSGVNAFVHLAAVIPAAVSDLTTDAFLKVNTLGTFYALEHCRRNGIKKFIGGCSRFLYEDVPESELPLTEKTGYRFSMTGDHASYVISKIAAADYVEHYSQEFGLRGVVLRFTGLLGSGRFERDSQLRPSAFEIFYRRAKAGKDLEIWGKGTARRDALSVKDAARAVEAAIRADSARGLYLIGSGVGRTVAEEVAIFSDVFGTPGRPISIVRRPEMPEKEKSYVFDISKAKAELGWEPMFGYADLLRDYDREVAGGRFATRPQPA